MLRNKERSVPWRLLQSLPRIGQNGHAGPVPARCFLKRSKRVSLLPRRLQDWGVFSTGQLSKRPSSNVFSEARFVPIFLNAFERGGGSEAGTRC